MTTEIRSLTFGEVLDRSFSIFRANFVLIFTISVVVYGPYGLAMAAAEELGPLVAVMALLLVMLVGPLTFAALTIAISERMLGREITAGEAYRGAARIFLPMLGTYLIFYLALAGAFLLLVIPGVYFSIAWSLAAPVMVIEKRFGVKTLTRSRELVRGHWWKVLGVLVVTGIVLSLATMALEILWAFVPLLGPVLSACTTAVTSAYFTLLPIVLYFDLRCRHEDFDLHFLAEELGREGASSSAQTLPAS